MALTAIMDTMAMATAFMVIQTLATDFTVIRTTMVMTIMVITTMLMAGDGTIIIGVPILINAAKSIPSTDIISGTKGAYVTEFVSQVKQKVSFRAGLFILNFTY